MSDQTITAADLARRFGLSQVKAHRWLRELPHVNVGRHRFTTEPWLAGWMAAQVKNPPPVNSFDPLEGAVIERAIWLIERLVERGRLQVVGLRVAYPIPFPDQPSIHANP